MTVTALGIFEAVTPVAATETPVYTSPAGTTRTILDKFTATNTGGAVSVVTVKIIPFGGAAGTGNIIVSAMNLAAGASYTFPEIVGHVLQPGDILSVISSVATVNFRGSGRQVV